MKFETRAIHVGMGLHNPSASVVPPISPSTIFEIDAEGRKEGDLHYTRLGNPNRLQFEAVIASLEGGVAAAAFASGIAAATAVMQCLEPGDHVLVPEDVYAGNRKMVQGLMGRWNLEAEFVDMTDVGRVAERIRGDGGRGGDGGVRGDGERGGRTKLIWMETPSNPLMQITDVRAVCELAKAHGIRTLVDNTWPTPVNQRPLELGADLVLHSTSKYFGGHSDLLGGAIVVRDQDTFYERLTMVQKMGGAVPSPHDCWMLSRSTRSLAVRMRAHNDHAMAVAQFLEGHKRVKQVFYPGLPSHPGHEIARSQMDGFGGMISFLIDGGEREGVEIVGRSRLIRRATSLGGVESTWEHRRSSEGEGSVSPDNLIRLSVGLEHPDDLIEDLATALA